MFCWVTELEGAQRLDDNRQATVKVGGGAEEAVEARRIEETIIKALNGY